jgi:hypothetical protein
MTIDDLIASAKVEAKSEVLMEVLSMSHRVGKYYQISISDFDDIVRNITNTPDKGDEPCPT